MKKEIYISSSTFRQSKQFINDLYDSLNGVLPIAKEEDICSLTIQFADITISAIPASLTRGRSGKILNLI